MRIQHNIPALNAHRNLTNNNSAVSKNLEKLSSGYRINRAGDDAAGLAISEKMRAQITGLETAQKNAEDGVSLVQTAEGALTEVHSMLNRMVELATQAANGTYSESNREEMQKEINALNEEIDRISNTANFNGTKLFTTAADGAAAAAATDTPTAVDITGTWGTTALTAATTPAAADVFTSGALTAGDTNESVITVTYKDAAGQQQTKDIAFTPAGNTGTDAFTAFKTAFEADTDLNNLFTVGGADTGITFTAKTAGADKGAITGLTIKSGNATIAAGTTTTAGADEVKTVDLSATPQAGDSVTIDGKTYTFAAGATGDDGATFSDLATLATAAAVNGVTLNTADNTKVTATKAGGGGDQPAGGAVTIDLHVGESSADANKITVTIDAMSSNTLGVDGVDITEAATAKTAIDTINDAIDQVSSIRSSLGAMQNRLEHTINNLGVQTENITAAESRIRDVDMAKEMMAYTKNNILVQASQAMLAQANQVPQGVLQLLQ